MRVSRSGAWAWPSGHGLPSDPLGVSRTPRCSIGTMRLAWGRAPSPTLELAEIARARHKPTESLDAYDVYLRGMASVYRWTKEGVSEALRLFGKAIESDSSLAAAYGMAAWCYVRRRMHGWMSERDKEIAEAHRLALKAVELGTGDAF